MHKVTSRQAALWNLKRLGLVHPFADGKETIYRLVAVQAQDFRAACEGIRLRTKKTDGREPSAHANPLLTPHGHAVRIWTIRGTMHLVPANEARYHQKANCNDWFSRWGRFLDRRLTLSREQIIRDVYPRIVHVLNYEPQGYSQIGEKAGLNADYVRLLPHIVKDLCYLGYCTRWSGDGRKATYSKAFYPKDPGLTEDMARRHLLSRFIANYGPVTLADMAYWSGWRSSVVKGLLQDLLHECARIELERQHQPAYILREQLEPLLEVPDVFDLPTHFLPAYDVLLLAYKDKSRFMAQENVGKVFLSAARVAPCVLEKGRVVGTWRKDEPGVVEYF